MLALPHMEHHDGNTHGRLDISFEKTTFFSHDLLLVLGPS